MGDSYSSSSFSDDSFDTFEEEDDDSFASEGQMTNGHTQKSNSSSDGGSKVNRKEGNIGNYGSRKDNGSDSGSDYIVTTRFKEGQNNHNNLSFSMIDEIELTLDADNMKKGDDPMLDSNINAND